MIVCMAVEDLLNMDYVDYLAMNIICDDCDKPYDRFEYLDTAEYIAWHYNKRCPGFLTYTTADIIDWKIEDDHFPSILQSLKENHTQPIVGISGKEIIDGGHRLAAAVVLGLRRVLVEDDAVKCSSDSGNWKLGKPIVPIPSRSNK
jgi:hypothetical protein